MEHIGDCTDINDKNLNTDKEFDIYSDGKTFKAISSDGTIVAIFKLTKSFEDIRKNHLEQVLRYRFGDEWWHYSLQLDDIFLESSFIKLLYSFKTK